MAGDQELPWMDLNDCAVNDDISPTSIRVQILVDASFFCAELVNIGYCSNDQTVPFGAVAVVCRKTIYLLGFLVNTSDQVILCSPGLVGGNTYC